MSTVHILVKGSMAIHICTHLGGNGKGQLKGALLGGVISGKSTANMADTRLPGHTEWEDVLDTGTIV